MIKKYAPFSTNLVTGTHQCPPPHTGPRANTVCMGGTWAGGCRAPRDGGWGVRVTSNSPVIAKERETLETLSYDCDNPVIICLRAFARSAFLFTGSPRSARDDKGEQVPKHTPLLSFTRRRE